MEFLGIGYQEILLILAVTLIFVGPERMPAVAYQIGRAVRQMQRYARAVRDEFSEEFSYLEEEYRTVRGEVEETSRSLRAEQQQLESEMRESTQPVGEALSDAERSARANVVPLSSSRERPTPPPAPPSSERGEARPSPGANGSEPPRDQGERQADGPPLVF